jgi:hypothetical protein
VPLFRITSYPHRVIIAVRYALGAILLSAAAFGTAGYVWWLLWPAISLVLISGNYAYFEGTTRTLELWESCRWT